MKIHDPRRIPISEVSRLTEVPAHLLRQWEDRIPQLKPERDRARRRFYSEADIAVVRRIKHLRLHEKLTFKGIARKLSQELHGEGAPKSNREVVDLIDKLESEIRAMLDMLDKDENR